MTLKNYGVGLDFHVEGKVVTLTTLFFFFFSDENADVEGEKLHQQVIYG